MLAHYIVLVGTGNTPEEAAENLNEKVADLLNDFDDALDDEESCENACGCEVEGDWHEGAVSAENCPRLNGECPFEDEEESCECEGCDCCDELEIYIEVTPATLTYDYGTHNPSWVAHATATVEIY